jgi:hypothetical protein
MKKISTIITVSLLFTLLILIACGKENRNANPFLPDSEAKVLLSGIGACEKSSPASLAASRKDKLLAVSENGKVSFTHSYAVFNCCMDSISLEIEVRDQVVRVVEKEHCSVPCFCDCEYTIYGEILDLEPGNYILEICSGADVKVVYCSVPIRVDKPASPE